MGLDQWKQERQHKKDEAAITRVLGAEQSKYDEAMRTAEASQVNILGAQAALNEISIKRQERAITEKRSKNNSIFTKAGDTLDKLSIFFTLGRKKSDAKREALTNKIGKREDELEGMEDRKAQFEKLVQELRASIGEVRERKSKHVADNAKLSEMARRLLSGE